jgi:hypothetical protein
MWFKTTNGEKTLHLHIGMGRCGSTSIQAALCAERKKLMKAGFLYTHLDEGGEAHHSLCPLQSNLLSNARSAWNRLGEEFFGAKEKNLIVSSENLIGISGSLISHIQDVFRACKVRILFIARDQVSLLPSIYAQWTKAGIRHASFRSFYNATYKLWQYPEILARWKKTFGRENIYCSILNHGDDAVNLFAKLFPGDELNSILSGRKTERLNRSISSLLLPLIEMFDDACSPQLPVWHEFSGWDQIEPPGHAAGDPKRVQFIAAIERLSLLIDSNNSNRLEDADLAFIKKAYAQSNQDFQNEYLGASSNYVLFQKHGSSTIEPKDS